MTIELSTPFDEFEIIQYTEGDCWMLARAMHKLTGWPIWWIGSEKLGETEGWCHVAVETPDGEMLDVTGAKSKEDFKKYWLKSAIKWRYVDSYEELEVAPVRNFRKMVKGMPPVWTDATMAREDAKRLLWLYNYSKGIPCSV